MSEKYPYNDLINSGEKEYDTDSNIVNKLISLRDAIWYSQENGNPMPAYMIFFKINSCLYKQKK